MGYSEGATVSASLILEERRRLEEEGRPRRIKVRTLELYKQFPNFRKGSDITADRTLSGPEVISHHWHVLTFACVLVWHLLRRLAADQGRERYHQVYPCRRVRGFGRRSDLPHCWLQRSLHSRRYGPLQCVRRGYGYPVRPRKGSHGSQRCPHNRRAERGHQDYSGQKNVIATRQPASSIGPRQRCVSSSISRQPK